MQTKEQIAKKYVPCRCDEAYTSRGVYDDPCCPYHSADVESAMDEWAIEFGLWLNKLDFSIVPKKDSMQELYKQFLQSIQQP